ncbi:MAG: MgtC/SapB family protein [Nitrospirae bacterium]|nr:MgtC/SapB family protein [Nitrospirota bacterium]
MTGICDGSFIQSDALNILLHLLVAVAAGGFIGIERRYHGRPAGFRTHALVCMASSLLMLVSIFQAKWFPAMATDTVRIDPTRMAQGVMTEIGFLGAGVIMKEGITVRGLTTAASIWITAAIGILAGVGFYVPVVIATCLTVGVLTVFRWLELRMPALTYAHHRLRFNRALIPSEDEIRKLISDHGFTIANMSYNLTGDGRFFEYSMSIRTVDKRNTQRLAETLSRREAVVEFRIAPFGD